LNGNALIRDAVPGDVAAFTKIYRHWVETGTMSFELEAPDEAEMARRFGTVLEAGYPWLTLEADGVIAGYAYGSAYRPRPAYRFTVEDSIYLAHQAVGQGLGRLLLDELLSRFREAGYRSAIGIISDPEANPASVAMHKRAGFSEFGRASEIGFKFGRWIDVAYLQLKLA